jgi:cellulose synthase/poly-beta-1,6-N-acetylglucosamine synthase-like glycosyltransferase
VGAVSGSLGVRNASASLITRHQAIEYAIGIALGRIVQDSLGILSIVSGAFGAFRRAALEQVGGQDVEVGEDADLTMKLRRAGWRIRFAPDAHALTDAPETVSALMRSGCAGTVVSSPSGYASTAASSIRDNPPFV